MSTSSHGDGREDVQGGRASRSKTFQCDFDGCTRSFHKVSYLSRHKLSHTDERPFGCPNCDKRFRRRENMVVHLKGHAESLEERKPFACTFESCDARFPHKYHLTRHLKVHGKPLPYECKHPGCTLAYSKHSQLRSHMTEHTGKLPFPCPDCDASFVTGYKLKVHQNTVHAGEKRYVCGYEGCGQGFPKWSMLQSHHRNVHKFTCSICKRAFARAHSLKEHMATHELDRDHFKCTWEGCDRVFYSSKNREAHIRASHHQIRPYLCDVEGCTSSFAHKHLLVKHLNAHKKGSLGAQGLLTKKRRTDPDDIALLTGLDYEQTRSIACTVDGCLFRFKRLYDLDRHLAATHGISPLKIADDASTGTSETVSDDEQSQAASSEDDLVLPQRHSARLQSVAVPALQLPSSGSLREEQGFATDTPSVPLLQSLPTTPSRKRPLVH